MEYAQKLTPMLIESDRIRTAAKEEKEKLKQALENGDGDMISCGGKVYSLVTRKVKPSLGMKNCKTLLGEFIEQNESASFDKDEFLEFVKGTFKEREKTVQRLKISNE